MVKAKRIDRWLVGLVIGALPIWSMIYLLDRLQEEHARRSRPLKPTDLVAMFLTSLQGVHKM